MGGWDLLSKKFKIVYELQSVAANPHLSYRLSSTAQWYSGGLFAERRGTYHLLQSQSTHRTCDAQYFPGVPNCGKARETCSLLFEKSHFKNWKKNHNVVKSYLCSKATSPLGCALKGSMHCVSSDIWHFQKSLGNRNRSFSCNKFLGSIHSFRIDWVEIKISKTINWC